MKKHSSKQAKKGRQAGYGTLSGFLYRKVAEVLKKKNSKK